MNRDRLRDSARGGFRAFLLASGLLAVYGIEYMAGWIPPIAFVVVAWLLLAVAVVAVAVAVPWLVLTAVDALRDLRYPNSLDATHWGVEGRMARPAAAACSQELAHPGEPPSNEQDFQTPSPQADLASLCREVAPRVADQRDDAAATRGASQISGLHAGERPPR